MSAKPKDSGPKRANRAMGVGEAANGALDAVLKKRGFASRDIVSNWAAIVPAPYDRVAAPDKLTWPRGERGTEGAVLHLRALAGHGFAVAQDGPRIAAAINRYFGYVLVGQVRLSPSPFTPNSAPARQSRPVLDEDQRERLEAVVNRVENEGLREALRLLGEGVLSRSPKQDGQ